MFVFEIIRPYRLLRFNGDGNTYYFDDNAVRIFVGRYFQRNGSSSLNKAVSAYLLKLPS